MSDMKLRHAVPVPGTMETEVVKQVLDGVGWSAGIDHLLWSENDIKALRVLLDSGNALIVMRKHEETK